MQGVRLIVESVTFATTLVSLTHSYSERLLAAVWTKKSPDSWLREKRAKTDLLYLKFNSLSFVLGFESIGPLISTL
jgi:hypothetical protein